MNQFPEFDPLIMSITDYTEKINRYYAMQNKSKYVIILGFMNELFDEENVALSDFNMISKDDVLRNKGHNKKVIDTWNKKIKIDIDMEKYKDMKYYDSADDLFTITYIRKALVQINYSLVLYERNDKKYYRIKAK